ncbi:MAG: serine hydrolase domain-containing protein [Pseudomonadota bacterium]
MKDVEAAVRHKSGVTTYEWRIDLGRHIYPGKTIGFDLIVQDVDEDGTRKRLQWGPQGYKNLIAGRLGDIILAMQNEVIGDAQGRVGWAKATDVALPTHVRLVSADRPAVWVDVRVDETGLFQTKLPQGRYFVESPWLTNQPFAMFGATNLARIKPSQPASIVVDEGARSSSAEVLFEAAPAPDHLFGDQPVLPNYTRESEARVDEFIEAYREHFGITGLSVALIHDGEVVYDKQFGVADTIAMTPVGPDTLFEMASISKSLFALTAMRLVERGELHLDRPLVEYLPFPQLENDEQAAKMTARHVLSHQSGLPNWAWSNDPRGWRTGGPISLSFSPGDRFGYSGEAYGYLARVIEKITGTPIDETIEEELLDPLALTSTFPSADDEQANRVALGHSHYFPTFFSIERDVWVAGSMYSNAGDLARIAAAFMSGKIVSNETRIQVLTPEVTVPEEFLEGSNGWEESYGLGFHMQNSPVGTLAGHGGNNGDFQTRFGIIPDRGIGYVVFANNNSGHRFIEEFERFLFVGRPHAGD